MKTILLKTDKNKSYYLTSLTKDQKLKLYQAKKENTLEDLTYKLGINCEGVLAVGEVATAKVGVIARYVSFFLGKDIGNTLGQGAVGHNREIHYRNYNITQEKQEKQSWLINACEDSASSGRSALSIMDEQYCCIWEIYNETPFKETMDKLLKNKKWIRH